MNFLDLNTIYIAVIYISIGFLAGHGYKTYTMRKHIRECNSCSQMYMDYLKRKWETRGPTEFLEEPSSSQQNQQQN